MAKVRQEAAKRGWRVLDTKGEGGQGAVYVVQRADEPNGQHFALKELRKPNDKAYQRFRQEYDTLKEIDHPGIVKVRECAKEDDSWQYFIMDYDDEFSSLRQLVGTNKNPFYNDALKSIGGFIKIVEALAACEKKNIVHRDLSLGNVLVADDGRIRIIDFGLCQIEDGASVTLIDEAVGTPHYRPPECSAHTETPITIQADLYSAGKILWSMVTNMVVFDRERAAFDARSLPKVLQDNISSWHLQRVFENTIRESLANRYKNTEEALAGAKNVRRLIVQGYKPLEELAEKICPFCGSHQFWNEKYNEAHGQFGVILRQSKMPGWTCGYCFHHVVASYHAQKRFLDDRKNYS